jgi:hypothetical protein
MLRNIICENQAKIKITSGERAAKILGEVKGNRMKPLQHAQISAKTYGGDWSDYVEIHGFLDSSKAACAHFKHRFLLHHVEGIELGVKIFGETISSGEGRAISTRGVLRII